MSDGPPGGKPTMMRTGRAGKACAQAIREAAGSAAAPAARCRKFRRGSFHFAPPSPFTSFDHVVGALLENPRHVETECFGGLEVDHQLELDRCLAGKLARLLALEDAIDTGCCVPYLIERVTSVGQQAADLSEVTERIDGREAVASRQQGDLGAMAGREDIRHHDQTTIRLPGL